MTARGARAELVLAVGSGPSALALTMFRFAVFLEVPGKGGIFQGGHVLAALFAFTIGSAILEALGRLSRRGRRRWIIATSIAALG